MGADFSTTATSTDLVEFYPGGVRVSDLHEAATFDSGAAVLHSSGSGQEAIMSPLSGLEGPPPADVVVVADLKELSDGSTIGVAPRCTDDACILVEVDSDGKYRFVDREGSSSTYPVVGDLNGDSAYPALRLNPGQENRLIVWLSHDTLGATVNGRLLGTLKVKAPAFKQAFFFHRSLSKDKPSHVAVTRIYFFGVAP